MVSVMSGAALIGASIAVIYAFIPRKDVQSTRSEWIDIIIAITFTAGLAIGVSLIVVGIVSFWG